MKFYERGIEITPVCGNLSSPELVADSVQWM